MKISEVYNFNLSQAELDFIERFNREVGNQGWTSVRGSYLVAIHQQFDER